jgi:hypothetical protein
MQRIAGFVVNKIKILFLAANPKDTGPLRLGEEVSAIDEELLKARYRDKFDLEQKHAVKVEDLSQHLLQVEPDIVHFSGHGSKTGQIYLEDVDGNSHPVSEGALSSLFSILGNVKCVILNACYSENQAKAISQHVDCVIGMSQGIGDEAAIKFAQGFYRGLAYGLNLEDAFRLGCSQIDLHNLDVQDIPKILWKNEFTKKTFNLKKIENLKEAGSYKILILFTLPFILGALGFIITGANIWGLSYGFAVGGFLCVFLFIIIAIIYGRKQEQSLER